MKETKMKIKKEKGAIAIFVLIALLFMSAFLILSYGNNLNKEKIVQEQFSIINQIYSFSGGDEAAYQKAYSDLREKNKQTLNANVTNSGYIEVTKAFADKISNFRIYGNSIQDGTPTPENPVEIESVGKKVNLLSLGGRTEDTRNANWDNTAARNFTGNKIFVGITHNNFYYSSYVTNYNIDEEENRVTLTTTSNLYGIGLDIKVYPNTNYTLSVGECTGGIRVVQYTKDGNIINASGVMADKITITTTDQTGWLLIVFMDKDKTKEELNFHNIQLEEGSTATEYVPYGKYLIPIKQTNAEGESIINNIYLDEPLRKIGDVADYIDFATGKVVRNITRLDVDGTENYSNSKTDYDLITIRMFPNKTPINKNSSLLLSDQYKNFYTLWNYNNTNYSWRISRGPQSSNQHTLFLISVENEAAGITTEDSKDERTKKLADYIKEHNFYVIYPVETPTEETITLPELSTYEDYTKIEVLTDIAPSKIEMEYTGYTLD